MAGALLLMGLSGGKTGKTGTRLASRGHLHASSDAVGGCWGKGAQGLIVGYDMSEEDL